jgi:hypothetical protein
MELFEVYAFGNNNPSYLHSIRSEIDMDPIYQRQGQIWSPYKRQLLIDSIINGFDLPKIYIHKYPEPVKKEGRRYQYALVDGKQRLEAIFDFIDNKFPLAPSFEFLSDKNSDLKNLTFKELGEKYPQVISRFVSTSLPIQVIRTSDTELIEEMFSRLNEAVPLNAPEQRNAFGGPAPVAVKRIADHEFFTSKLPFSDNRYRHRDLAAKFLLWEDDWETNSDSVKDVKKKQLDDFFREVRKPSSNGKRRIETATAKSLLRLDALLANFVDSDMLLRSVGIVSVYYILMQDRQMRGLAFPARASLAKFEKHRREDLAIDDEKLTRGHVALLEFNRLSQSPNDNGALVYRYQVIDAYTAALDSNTDPLVAIGPLAPEQKSKRP